MTYLAVIGLALNLLGAALNLLGVVLMSRSLVKHVEWREFPSFLLSALVRGPYSRGVAKSGFGEVNRSTLIQGLALVVLGILLQLVASVLSRCEIA